MTARRKVLAGAGAALAAAACLAGAKGAEAATGDDRRILALCARFDELERQRRDLYPQSNSPRVIEDDDERDAAIEPIEDKQDDLLDQMMPLRASSPPAVVAMARSLALWAPDYACDPTDTTRSTDARLLGWILQNAQAIDGREA